MNISFTRVHTPETLSASMDDPDVIYTRHWHRENIDQWSFSDTNFGLQLYSMGRLRGRVKGVEVYTIRYRSGIHEILMDIGETIHGSRIMQQMAMANEERFKICDRWFHTKLFGPTVDVETINTRVLAKMGVPWSVVPRIIDGEVTSYFDLVFRNEADAMTYRLLD